MDRFGKAIAMSLLIRSDNSPRPPGEFPDGFPDDMICTNPEEPPFRGKRARWQRIGLLVFFFLLILLARWVATNGQDAAASPQGTAFTNTNQTLNDEGVDAALGDLDGDGDVDAFFARNGFDEVWLNDGNGVFATTWQILGSNMSVAVALGDLDGDTDLDAVVLEDTATAMVLWFNQGGTQGGDSGTFAQSGGPAFGPDMPGAVALGDLDGDGDLDIFMARILGRPSQVWLNDGSGQFSDSGQTLINAGSLGVTLGDVDNDGDLDAFAADGAQLRLWINQGGSQGGTEGVFADAGQTLPTALSVAVTLGDVDGDGDADAVSAQVNSGWQVWLNQGGNQGGTVGMFAAAGSPLGESSNRHLALADVNGDGALDVFVARAGANTVWLNLGNGVFQDSGVQMGDLFSEAVALADLDGDADPDAVVANFDEDNEVWCNGACEALPPATTWQLEAVYTKGQVTNADMTMDGYGRTHIVFVQSVTADSLHYQLKYLVWDTVTWHESLVGERWNSPGVPKILVASAGKLHIFLGNLHYFQTNTEWAVEAIPYPENMNVTYTLPVVDRNNNVLHVFGLTQSKKLVHMMNHADEGWTVISTDLFGTLSSTGRDTLAGQVDGQGHVFLMYLKDGLLHYAAQNGEGWDEFSMSASAEGPFSMVVDEQSEPHFAYRSPGNHYPLYASWVFGGDTIQAQAASAISLALNDAGKPVVVWQSETGEVLQSQFISLGNWLTAPVTDGNVSLQAFLLYDERSRVLIRENGYQDLWVAWSGPAWEENFAAINFFYSAPTLAVKGDTPALAYHANAANAFYAPWDDPWKTTLLGPITDPAFNVPLLYDSDEWPHLAYYQSTPRTLIYTHFEDQVWYSETAHTFPTEQTLQPMLFLLKTDYSASVGLGYTVVEGGELYLGLSLRDANGSWTHTKWNPGLGNPAEFPFAAEVRGDGTVVFLYAYNNTVYRATYAQGQWTSNPIMSSVMPTHLALAIETRRTYSGESTPPQILDRETFAFADGLSGELRYAADVDGIWQMWTVGEPAFRDEVALVHRAGYWRMPVIATLGADNAVLVTTPNDEMTVWTTEVVAEAGLERSYLSVAYGGRERLAWLENFGGTHDIVHAFRRAPMSMEGTAQLNESQSLVGGLYRGGCLCIFFGTNGCTDGWAARVSTVSPETYTPTGNVMVDLTALFQATPDGYNFAQTYISHDHELWSVIFADSELLWDSYRTLNNLLPGLEALTTGQGSQVTISQEMMDQTVDIWQRVAAEASPALAEEINGRLLATNNLQEYVGMTFDEWAISLGVEPFGGYAVYLPVLNK